jgi:glycerol uptake facilitator protein
MNIFLAEFFGTLLLILLGNGVVASVLLSRSKGENSGWIVITAGWAFAVAIAVYAVAWISGAHLNPAITIAMAMIGKIGSDLVPQYLFGQFMGALAGSALVWLVYLPHWGVTESKSHKLMCFCTKPAIRSPLANLAVEIVATAVLLIGVLSLVNEKAGLNTGMFPYMIGILVFAIGLSLGGPTGFAINPARDLAPRVMHALLPIPGKGDSDWQYAWIPVVGPILGGTLGAMLYQAFIAAL